MKDMSLNFNYTLIRCLLFTLLMAPVEGMSEELTDAEKSAAFEARKPEAIKRLKDIYESTPPEVKALLQEIRAYNSGRSNELDLVRELMSPDADPLEQPFIIKELRFDETTIPMFETLLRESSDDRVKSKVVWRLRKEVLSEGYILNDEVKSLLKDYSQREIIYGGLRRASKITLEQAEEAEKKAGDQKSLQTLVTLPLDSQVDSEVQSVSVNEAKSEPNSLTSVDKESEEAPAKFESTEEAIEQSSNWWLWIIGALVVIGGLGLVLRRKS